MNTKTFTGKDQADIDRRIWEWQTAVPGILIATRHPLKWLARDLQTDLRKYKIKATDLAIQRIDYENSN